MGNAPAPRICDTCQKLMRPLMSPSRPQSSEWYCEADHHSVLMTADEWPYWMQVYRNSTGVDNEA
jgi:hypothetical protein